MKNLLPFFCRNLFEDEQFRIWYVIFALCDGCRYCNLKISFSSGHE